MIDLRKKDNSEFHIQHGIKTSYNEEIKIARLALHTLTQLNHIFHGKIFIW